MTTDPYFLLSTMGTKPKMTHMAAQEALVGFVSRTGEFLLRLTLPDGQGLSGMAQWPQVLSSLSCAGSAVQRAVRAWPVPGGGMLLCLPDRLRGNPVC